MRASSRWRAFVTTALQSGWLPSQRPSTSSSRLWVCCSSTASDVVRSHSQVCSELQQVSPSSPSPSNWRPRIRLKSPFKLMLITRAAHHTRKGSFVWHASHCSKSFDLNVAALQNLRRLCLKLALWLLLRSEHHECNLLASQYSIVPLVW